MKAASVWVFLILVNAPVSLSSIAYANPISKAHSARLAGAVFKPLIALKHKKNEPSSGVATRYLAFQVFTGEPDPKIAIGDSGTQPLGLMPSFELLEPFVKDIILRVGTVGDKENKLAVIFGPLAFDQSDKEISDFISNSFDLAIKDNVAVGFHLDDSMFWAGRNDLLKNPENVEWRDWKGTPSTGRQILWSPDPNKIAPQMCFNSKIIESEVEKRGLLIGKAITSGMDRLKSVGKEELFAGVIVGWETQIGSDFDSKDDLGYHAMANRGFSADKPPKDLDKEREDIVQEFITRWCKSVHDAGVPVSKIYSQVAFVPESTYDAGSMHTETYSQLNHFAPPGVAFGEDRIAGFSAYPEPGVDEEIYTDLAMHGNPSWAVCEGTNLQPGGNPGDTGMNMETYLGRKFNHGAVLVNLF